ncbi:creatininase family protein [Streptomyces lavendulae]|uniref:creatininase family protein n=1 Tax=Streptomyces lavendulae TaxID=1914 RepID=UPI0036819AF3
MTWPDLNPSSDTHVFIPVGALEPHGPHLPLGSDTMISNHFAHRLAAAVEGHVAPPLGYGVATPDQRLPWRHQHHRRHLHRPGHRDPHRPGPPRLPASDPAELGPTRPPRSHPSPRSSLAWRPRPSRTCRTAAWSS